MATILLWTFSAPSGRVILEFATHWMQCLARYINEVSESNEEFTLADMARYVSVAGITKILVDDAAQVADQMEELVDIGGVDGFNVVPVTQPDRAHELVDLLIPELQRRGRFKTEYEGSTLREHFPGVGQSRLESAHPAAA